MKGIVPQLPQFGHGRPLVSNLDQFKKPAALNRYRWAASVVRKRKLRRVIDAACGCGYGTRMMADAGGASTAVGIDVDEIAIKVAETYWTGCGVRFLQGDIRDIQFGLAYDAVVSIETIEHVKEPLGLIEKFWDWAPVLIATVPHEKVVPFDPEVYRFHHCHYTADEFYNLLREFYQMVELGTSPDGKELRAVAIR